jgi:Hemolysin-type calcium-binding repeat (2 copies).
MSRTDRIVAAIFAISLLAAPAAQAANITPTTFFDDNTANGNCTLREAVRAANSDAPVDACPAGSGADTITLGAGNYGLSLGPTGEQAAVGGDFDITDPDGLSIVGAAGGSGVIAEGVDRAFEVIGPAVASFDRVLITGGANGGAGGGIEVGGGARATLVRSTVSGNNSPTGGGLDVVGPSSLTVVDSTVAGNVAPGGLGSGGGINAESGALLNVTNSTISGNSAGFNGGGIHVIGLTRPTVNVVSSTISANSAANGGGTFPEAGNTVNMKGSILAGNSGGASGPDCGGALNSQGNNLIGSTVGCPVSSLGSDIIGQAQGLGPLADNGGPTQTHALLATSPAIDKGPADAPATDQRGIARSGPDIGAYEFVTCLGVPVNRIGTDGNDNLTGTPGPDGFLLLGGNDTAFGLGGNDGLCGAAGNDSLNGGAGNDGATGNAGKDRLTGGSGKDNLSGGSGPDKLFGGAGKDKLKGFGGKDRLRGQGGRDTCNGGGGKDKASSCERRKRIP